MTKEYLDNHFTYDSTNLYNNEILGAISIFYILKHIGKMSSSTSMLVLPLSFHNSIVSYLNDSRTVVKSLDQFIIKRPDLFSNFNERFYSLLEISANSVLVLSSMNIISISNNGELILELDDEELLLNSIEKKDIGKRAYNIIKASKGIAELLADRKENLFLQLRVEL
ncbi:three component ABC system middle component [Gracilibacillus sp. D59]|uniref:three component ABC system middle component n=1 Tax=Gracilibacillus sp. D59 TaxID=3457434 RepID=UPI003FCCE580